jgi:hypothetical protein
MKISYYYIMTLPCTVLNVQYCTLHILDTPDALVLSNCQEIDAGNCKVNNNVYHKQGWIYVGRQTVYPLLYLKMK